MFSETDSDWETEEDEDMPWMVQENQPTRLMDASEDKENQGRNTGSPEIFRPYLEADEDGDENFWDSDSDSEFDLEAKINKGEFKNKSLKRIFH